MKTKTMAAVGAWLVAAVACVVLGSTFSEPVAAAKPARPETQIPVAEAQVPPPPDAKDAPVELEPTVIVAARPKAARMAVTTWDCGPEHDLLQGGPNRVRDCRTH